MSYIKYVAKDFQEVLEGNIEEDLDSGNVSSMNSVYDLVGEISHSMTTSACKRVVREYCTSHWQRKWNIAETGRSTYELIPTVGQKPQLPSRRNVAVSFVRILLHESNLHRQPYKLSANTIQLCNCGQSVDDLEHFLLECKQYDKARHELVSAITDVWNDSEQS